MNKGNNANNTVLTVCYQQQQKHKSIKRKIYMQAFYLIFFLLLLLSITGCFNWNNQYSDPINMLDHQLLHDVGLQHGIKNIVNTSNCPYLAFISML